MTRLVLWRHGRTGWNVTGRFQGHLDVDLDEVGVAQAEASAARVAGFQPDVIVSSDLRRAASTADRLGALVGLPVERDPRLRERHFGPWEGLTREQIARRHPDDFAGWTERDAVVDPAIEPFEDVCERVSAALHDIVARIGDSGTAVVVTHGGAARAGCVSLLGWPPEAWRSLGSLDNCHVTVLRRSERSGWRLSAHNVA